jgi:peroxiredoxin family protein
LKEDVNLFIEKEMGQLEEISSKAEEIPEDDAEIIMMLKKQEYEGLNGAIMDTLWSNCADDPGKIQAQEETADFIKIKEEEVKGISEHFEHLNQMDYDNFPA